MSIYKDMYPMSLRTADSLGAAFCCDEVKCVHNVGGYECGPVCVFCEDACPECGSLLF